MNVQSAEVVLRDLDGAARRSRRRIAGIRCTRRLDQQKMRLFFSDGAMLDTLWNDEHLARTEGDVAVAHADGDAALEHKEEVVGVVVSVPNELTLDLDDHEVVTIELADHAWLQ